MRLLSYRVLIGADEAGYGPNLGPLLVVATAWRVPSGLDNDAFSAALGKTFQQRAWSSGCGHVPLGDSKQLYKPASGLASLESGLLALVHQLDARGSPSLVNDLQKFTDFVTRAANSSDERAAPWYSQLDRWTVPVCHPLEEVERLAAVARAVLSQNAIQLIGIRASLVTESLFNQQVAVCGSKGQLLSNVTLELVRSFCDELNEPTEVFCDRQGGRTNYLPVLMESMPDCWFVETLRTSLRCSYRSTGEPQRVFHFTVGGDSFAPTALASMMAKYLRERMMQAFNFFWQSHLPELSPTAGYPQDAKRFREQIAGTANKLNLPETLWWRCR